MSAITRSKVFSFGKRRKPPSLFNVERSHPLSRGLLGWWLINEGAGRIARNISADSNHGTLVNFTIGNDWIGSERGQTLNFGDGITTRIDLDYRIVLPGELTLSAWFNLDTTSGNCVLLGNDNNAYDYQILLQNSKWYFRTSTGYSGGKYPPGGSVFIGEWHNFCVTRDNSNNLDFFWDGVAFYNTTQTGTAGVDTIGSGTNGTTGNITGKLDDVRVYNRALSPGEVRLLVSNPYENLIPIFPIQIITGTTGYSLTAETGTFTLTGNDASLLKQSKLTADVGTFTLTGNDVNLFKQYSLTVETGTFNLTGNDVSLLKQSLLTAGTGAFNLTGNDVNLFKQYSLTVETGSFILTGNDINLNQYHLTVDTGAFNFTGNDVSLLKQSKLTAETGTFNLTGNDVSLFKQYALTVGTGTFNLTGNDVNLLKQSLLTAGTGAFNLTGFDIDLFKQSLLTAETGIFNLIGNDISFVDTSILPTEIAAYITLRTHEPKIILKSHENSIIVKLLGTN